MIKLLLLLLPLIAAFILASWGASAIFIGLKGLQLPITPMLIWKALYMVGWDDTMLLAFLLPFGGIFAVLIAIIQRSTHPHGDARFASWLEVILRGLYSKKGIILGRHGSRLLRDSAQGHMIVVAPTGKGKGVGVVIPNLLDWQDSAIVLDIKGENFAITSGYRASLPGHKVYRFAPTERHTHCFNPLDVIRHDPLYRSGDASMIAKIILPLRPGMTDEFWRNEGGDLLVGLMLYVISDNDAPGTIGEIYRMLKDSTPLEGILRHLLEHEAEGLEPECARCFNSFIQKADKERSGVRSYVCSMLEAWQNPMLDAATSCSDMDVSRLRQAPATIYLCIPLDQLTAMSKVFNLFFETVTSVLARQEKSRNDPHDVLMLIDEFPSLGKMPVFLNMMSIGRSYGIRFLNVIQAITQLDTIYGLDGRETIMSGSRNALFFAANDDSTAKYISEKMGTTSITLRSRNRSLNTHMRQQGSISISEGQRRFMLPEEVRMFSEKHSILFHEHTRPIKARKIRYYRQQRFIRRLYEPATIDALDMGAPIAASYAQTRLHAWESNQLEEQAAIHDQQDKEKRRQMVQKSKDKKMSPAQRGAFIRKKRQDEPHDVMMEE